MKTGGVVIGKASAFPRDAQGQLVLPVGAVERFWLLVNRGTADMCWEWIGSRNIQNYGMFNLRGDLPRMAAYRFSYEISRCPVPADHVVHHTCHNHACVNPDHLVAIPRSENNRDRRPTAHSRRPPGYKPRGLIVRSPEERFWSRVHKLDGDNACWVWTGAKLRDGHGSFAIDAHIKVLAHRFSWELHRGTIPADRIICHDCPDGDNPACVNPDHLYLGTPLTNSQDQFRKGTARRAIGENHPNTNLTDELVMQMRRDYAAGDSTYYLQRKYSTGHSNVKKIIMGEAWKHLPLIDFSKRQPRDRRRNATLP